MAGIFYSVAPFEHIEDTLFEFVFGWDVGSNLPTSHFSSGEAVNILQYLSKEEGYLRVVGFFFKAVNGTSETFKVVSNGFGRSDGGLFVLLLFSLFEKKPTSCSDNTKGKNNPQPCPIMKTVNGSKGVEFVRRGVGVGNTEDPAIKHNCVGGIALNKENTKGGNGEVGKGNMGEIKA